MRGRAMPTPPIPAGSSERGFSLTEILVVVVIIGFTAVVSIPNFMRMRVVYNDQAALREVAGTHERARLEALKRHSQVGVTYDQTARTVTIFEDRDRGDDTAAGNDNGQWDAGEEVIGRVAVHRYLSFTRPDTGNPIDVGNSVATVGTVLYRTDGSLNPAAGMNPAVHFGDVKLNFFRVRVNRVTGGSTIEKWMSGTTWSKDRREWQWKY